MPDVEKAELLRSKRSLVAAGPPKRKSKPDIEEFYGRKLAIIQYLELVPGYEEEIAQETTVERRRRKRQEFIIQRHCPK